MASSIFPATSGEWTATKYAAYPYKLEADLENPNATGLRIVRGGGWAANRKMVRCAYRNGNNPRGRSSLISFASQELSLRLLSFLSIVRCPLNCQ